MGLFQSSVNTMYTFLWGKNLSLLTYCKSCLTVNIQSFNSVLCHAKKIILLISFFLLLIWTLNQPDYIAFLVVPMFLEDQDELQTVISVHHGKTYPLESLPLYYPQ